MKRIVIAFVDGSYTNIPGDRIEFERDYSMIFAYSGDRLVGAFEITSILRLHISERSEINEARSEN